MWTDVDGIAHTATACSPRMYRGRGISDIGLPRTREHEGDVHDRDRGRLYKRVYKDGGVVEARLTNLTFVLLQRLLSRQYSIYQE
jgi:hypothetical protein